MLRTLPRCTVRKKLLMLLAPYLKSWHHVRQPEQVHTLCQRTTRSTVAGTIRRNTTHPDTPLCTDIWRAQVPTPTTGRQRPRPVHPPHGHVDLLLPGWRIGCGTQLVPTRRHVQRGAHPDLLRIPVFLFVHATTPDAARTCMVVGMPHHVHTARIIRSPVPGVQVTWCMARQLFGAQSAALLDGMGFGGAHPGSSGVHGVWICTNVHCSRGQAGCGCVWGLS